MNKRIEAQTELLESFRTPDGDYVPMMMWFWNDTIVEEEISFQIAKFKEAGICDFFVHPLWGMTDDYLSDRFFRMIRYAVDEAKKQGMYFWIYDEYNWPSGMAGGYLIRDEPWTRNKVLKSMKVDLYAGQPANVCIRGELTAAQVIYGNKAPHNEDVTDRVEIRTEGEFSYLSFSNKSCASCTIWIYYTEVTRGLTTTGMWSSFSWFQEGYMDTNNPAAVRKYIDYTHERYKVVIGDEFGKTVKGVFTDEVNNMSMFDNLPGVTPWTGKLPEEFESEHGYSLLPKLYALNCDFLGDEVLKVRYDYWRTCTRLFRDAYMQQVADWCQDNGLILTGHLSGESTLYWHTFQMGDFYDAMTPFHIPGIDSILSKLSIDDPLFSLEAKLAASVAKYNGKNRIMCETFSGSGWDMKMGEAKRIVNRLMVHGINLIIYMGAYYSLDGARKKLPLGYPPSHGYNNPLFAHYEHLNSHSARLNYLSGITQPAGRVMVIIPQTAQYIHPYEAKKHDASWHGAAEALMRGNIEFDFGFEPMASEMQVKDGKLTFRGFEYDTVILPGMEYTTAHIADILAEFISHGGHTVFINALPLKAVDTGKVLNFADLCGIDQKSIRDAFVKAAPGKEALLIQLEGPGGTVIAANAMSGDLNGPFRAAITKLLRKDSEIFCLDEAMNEIYAGHRRNEQMELFFLANDSAEAIRVTGTINREGRLMLLDPASGEPGEPAVWPDANGRRFALELPGYHMIALALMLEEDPHDEIETVRNSPNSVKVLDGEWGFTAEEGNWLPLKLKLAENSGELLRLSQQDSAEELFNLIAELGDKAATDSAFGELPGGFGVDLGAEYVAISSFEADDKPDKLDLILELEENMHVFLNGVRLTAFEPYRLWGIREARLEISQLVGVGVNTLVITSFIPTWAAPHAIPTAMLRGNFSLSSIDAITAPVRFLQPDYWTRQGFRYFSGNGTYSRSFQLNDFETVLLCVPTTDVVTVTVNGQVAAVLPWPPYEVDITEYCVHGENLLSLSFTSSYSSLMDIEKITLKEQGVTVYESNLELIDSGLLAPPEIKVYMSGV